MPQPSPTSHAPLPQSPSTWRLALALSLLCFLLRLPALLALPIFGDEAIYLRWAQLIRQAHPWVSLCDPKPPLHFWLIAAVMKLAPDPLFPARSLSALAAAIAVPLILFICHELSTLARNSPQQSTGRLAGILAAVLMIFCPFLAFYQRLATADALFLTESLLAVLLALRWARRLTHAQNAWPSALLLGFALGLALLTRQGLSYTLCLIPLVAFLLQFLRNRNHSTHNSHSPIPNSQCSRALLQLAVTALLAFALWSPYLVANLKQDAANKQLTPLADLKSRILYQSDFTQSKTSTREIANRNFKNAFLPAYTPPNHQPTPLPTQGWFFFYLTPTIYIAALLGLIYLISRKYLLLFMFLAAWIALMLGPPILLGNVIYSRYVLAAVPPLLIAAAFLLADFLAFILTRRLHPAILWTLSAALLAAILLLPLLELRTQILDPLHQTFTVQDRRQFLSGWTAGKPTARALEALTLLAKKRPIVVITDAAWGIPADAAWVYLSTNPNINLFYNIPSVNGPLLLTPANSPDTYLLRKNKFLFTKPQPVTLPPNVPVFLIVNDPVHSPAGDFPAEPFFRNHNPNIGPPISFYGVDGQAGSDHVNIFPVH